jgi:ABC-2 type transport system ATP-binding protein
VSSRAPDTEARGEIEAENLRKVFDGGAAVQGVSFRVERGEVVGFLGPNGAGKSTTIRMLTGVFPPSSGRAAIEGYDVVRETIAARRQLGYLPERTPLYGDMTVARYLAFIADMKDIPGREANAAIRRAMGAAGIEHVAHRLVGNLSKGYRQRVGIAQALLGDPPVLILDEPTSGLDPEQVSEIRSLIRGLGDARRTVILSSHILSEVEQICGRVIIMAGGRVLAIDEPRRLEERLRLHREFAARVTGSAALLCEALGRIPHVVGCELEGVPPAADGSRRVILRVEHGHDARREIARVIVEQGCGLVEFGPVVMTLEEIFLRLVGEQSPVSAA